MPLRLHAIVSNFSPASSPAPVIDDGVDGGPSLVTYRELAGVVTVKPEFVADDQPPDPRAHHKIVDGFFQLGPVLPAPAGVVFRAPDVIIRWMELHYVALTGALKFVEERVGARVRAHRGAQVGTASDNGSDVGSTAAAADAYRALRRRAVASVPLEFDPLTGIVLAAAFLVEKDLWKEFGATVKEQEDAHGPMRFELTGPWPPFDFVHMRFGV